MGRGEGGGRVSTLYDEPISPAGRFFLRPELEQVIHCVLTFQNPVDVDAVKAVLKSSLINNCPRLRSLAVRERNGRHRWKELPEVDIDSHVIIVPEEEEEDRGKHTDGGGDYEEDRENDVYVNEYVAALASSPRMRREMPLWEMHVLPRRRRCFVLRFHHSVGDGLSLLALVLASCERSGDPGMPITFSGAGGEGKRRALSLAASIMGVAAGTWRAMKTAWYTLLYAADLSMHVVRRKEDKTIIAGGVGVELLPRKLATLALCLDDMKAVKNKLNASINDVFVGIISYGIAKYLKLKSINETSKDVVITGLIMVNTRGESSKDLLRSIREGKKTQWGNRLGYILLPIHLKRRTTDPLDYVRKSRAVLNRKKVSLEAQYSYRCGALVMSLFGTKAAAFLNYKILSNISLALSNVVGPLDAITFAENRINKAWVTTSSLPLALEIHMLTYDQKAFLNVLVAADIIPDPELLCIYFQEALQEMKSKATNAEDIG